MLTHDTTQKHVPVSNPNSYESLCGEWTHQSCWQTHPNPKITYYVFVLMPISHSSINPWIVIETIKLKFINSSYLSIFIIYFMPLLCHWAILRKLINSFPTSQQKGRTPKKPNLWWSTATPASTLENLAGWWNFFWIQFGPFFGFRLSEYLTKRRFIQAKCHHASIESYRSF